MAAAERDAPGCVAGCAIAPCCHPQLTWSALCNAPALERLGFEPADLELLLSLLRLSKERSLGGDRHRSWRHLTALGPRRIRQLGRAARRVLEAAVPRLLSEGRLVVHAWDWLETLADLGGYVEVASDSAMFSFMERLRVNANTKCLLE